MKGKILIVDDEKNLTLILEAMLTRVGFEVQAYNHSPRALRAIEDDDDLDLVITDLYMPELNGMDLMKKIQTLNPDLPVVMMTAFGTVEAAVNALKAGAFDFITKPFDQNELLNTAEKAVRTHQQRQSEPMEITRRKGEDLDSEFSMIGRSESIQEIFKVIRKIAPSPSTVLIRGESGTGKELVAYEIHTHSPRKSKPFIKLNCSAIPATLIESELFGYERGAFTGAVTSKPGRFELAHEGTLFLDEVGEMPIEMQAKLLRVLQEQEFERVGGIQSIRVDVRIIAATNKDLEAEVKAGRFREDLFYRLNVVPLFLPPLRERVDDIEVLIQFFIREFNQKLGRSVNKIEPNCLEALKTFQWPGNIRQLENVLERMVLMCEGNTLKVEDLPSEIPSPFGAQTGAEAVAEGATLKEIVRRNVNVLEKKLIEEALQEFSGNVTRAAEKLGLSRKGLQLKMKELGIKRIMESE